MTDHDHTPTAAEAAERDAAPADPATGSPTTRRTVIRTAGFVALAGGGAAALAACGASGTTTPSTGAAPSSEAPSSAAPSSTPSASASESASESAPAPSGPSAPTGDVPEGSGVILSDADYVITQPAAGEYKAFTSICTHQQCKVTEMRGDKIHCACHGSEFSITDGSVTQGPADEPLQSFPTTVSGGNVYVNA